MAIEYRGDDVLYLIVIPDEENPVRIFNQTGGSTSSEADEVELDTKDKTGSDYGKVTQGVSIEGILTEDDNAIKYIKNAQRNKQFIRIVELDTKTMETEDGLYMVSSFNREYSNGDYATYSIEGNLNGSITEGTLETVPEGAPESEIEEGADDEGTP